MTRLVGVRSCVVGCVVLAAVACGDDAPGGAIDAATPVVDSGATPDADPTAPDAAPAADADPTAPDAAAADANPAAPDAAMVADAAPPADAGPPPPDAAPAPDASTEPADAFRAADLDLRDPHAYFGLIGCTDVTDMPLAGFSVNGELMTAVTTDGDMDGDLDISLVVVFRPLDQAAASGVAEIGIADCTAPLATTECTPVPSAPLEGTTYTNMAAGTCMGAYPGTLSTEGYTPAVATPSGPCFVTSTASLTVELAGVEVPLQDVQAAATYNADPATQLTTGLVRGFISEATAATVLVPIPIVGDTPLTQLLPGGMGNCAKHDDRDLGLDGTTMGWWFYFNYTAPAVPYTP